MSSVKILQFQGVSLISRLIRFQTRSKYSHTALLTSDNTVIEAWHKGGVQEVASISTLHTPGTKVDVFEFTWKVDKELIEEFARKQVGCKYDFLAILRFLSRRPYTENDRWFCSELIASAAEYAGYPLIRLPSYEVSPRDIAGSAKLRYVETIVTE